MINLPILLQEICKPILGICKSLTDTWMWNWDWGRAIPRKGIHKWDFSCSVQWYKDSRWAWKIGKQTEIKWAWKQAVEKNPPKKNNELKKQQFSNRFESALVSIRWVWNWDRTSRYFPANGPGKIYALLPWSNIPNVSTFIMALEQGKGKTTAFFTLSCDLATLAPPPTLTLG